MAFKLSIPPGRAVALRPSEKLRAESTRLATLAAAAALIEAGGLPEIFIGKGRQLQRVTPEQCAKLMEIHAGDRPNDDVDDIPLYNAEGVQIGYVSYNGRTWLGDLRHHIEIPQRGVPTAAELFPSLRKH